VRHFIALALLAVAAAAQADTAEECLRHELTTYPFPHRPSAEQSEALKGCSADKLYYGIGMHTDYVRARQCAFLTESHDVLMMLYANGLGGPRNYTVAKMAACRAEAAPAEKEARLAKLARMQSGKEGPAPKIDLCDGAAAGALGARCADIRTALRDQEREDHIGKIAYRWSVTERAAFQQLRKLEGGFEEDLYAALLAFEARKLPAFPADALAKAEREMQQALAQAKGASATQRNWLAYRDAWVMFGKVRYPSVASHALKTYLTQKRAAMLKEQAAARN